MRWFLSKLVFVGLFGFLFSILLLVTPLGPLAVRFTLGLMDGGTAKDELALAVFLGTAVFSLAVLAVSAVVLGRINNSESACLSEIQKRFPGAVAAESAGGEWKPKQLGSGWVTNAAPFRVRNLRLSCGDGDFTSQWCLRRLHKGAEAEQLAILTIGCSHHLGQGVMALGRPGEGKTAVEGQPAMSAMASLQLSLADAGLTHGVKDGRAMAEDIWNVWQQSGTEAAVHGIYTGFMAGFSLYKSVIEKCLFAAPAGSTFASAAESVREEAVKVLKTLPLVTPIRGILFSDGEIVVVGGFCNGASPQDRAVWIETAAKFAQAFVDAPENSAPLTQDAFSAAHAFSGGSQGDF